MEVMDVQRLVGVANHIEEGDEDGRLDERRQATAHLREWVDVVLFVERHRFLVEALWILFVFLPQRGQLGGDPALFGLDATRGRQLVLKDGRDDQLDQDRQENDGDAERPDRFGERVPAQHAQDYLEDVMDRNADEGLPQRTDRVLEFAVH